MMPDEKQATEAPEKRVMVRDLPRRDRRALGQRGKRLQYLNRRTHRRTSG